MEVQECANGMNNTIVTEFEFELCWAVIEKSITLLFQLTCKFVADATAWIGLLFGAMKLGVNWNKNSWTLVLDLVRVVTPDCK